MFCKCSTEKREKSKKAANNMIVIYKTYCIKTLIKELHVRNKQLKSNLFNICPLFRLYDKMLRSHSDFVKSVELKLSEKNQDLPDL